MNLILNSWWNLLIGGFLRIQVFLCKLYQCIAFLHDTIVLEIYKCHFAIDQAGYRNIIGGTANYTATLTADIDFEGKQWCQKNKYSQNQH